MAAELGGYRLPVPPEVLAERPGLRSYEGRTIVVGVRPEDMEDASLASDAPADRRISSTVDLREALGSDVVVHFTVAARPPVTEDTIELAADVGQEMLDLVEQTAEVGQTSFVARLNPRTRAAVGEQIELVVDTTRLHFFDPDDGSGIYGQTEG